MRRLQWQLKLLGERNRDGSARTQHQRALILSLIAEELWQLARLSYNKGFYDSIASYK